ncbi:MAG: citrate lyase holo-[acyl-carrier protein] synthase [Suipraeoptans sp.]
MNEKASLSDVLKYRDKKDAIQKEMASEYKGTVIVSFSMNVPGQIKTNEYIYDVFIHSDKFIEAMFRDMEIYVYKKREIRDVAGYCAIYSISGTTAQKLKRDMVNIEETHPLGRLFDIDVLDQGIGISRIEIGKSPRKCLICNDDAKICSRSGTHKIDALTTKVEMMIKDYLD